MLLSLIPYIGPLPVTSVIPLLTLNIPVAVEKFPPVPSVSVVIGTGSAVKYPETVVLSVSTVADNSAETV